MRLSEPCKSTWRLPAEIAVWSKLRRSLVGLNEIACPLDSALKLYVAMRAPANAELEGDLQYRCAEGRRSIVRPRCRACRTSTAGSDHPNIGRGHGGRALDRSDELRRTGAAAIGVVVQLASGRVVDKPI